MTDYSAWLRPRFPNMKVLLEIFTHFKGVNKLRLLAGTNQKFGAQDMKAGDSMRRGRGGRAGAAQHGVGVYAHMRVYASAHFPLVRTIAHRIIMHARAHVAVTNLLQASHDRRPADPRSRGGSPPLRL